MTKVPGNEVIDFVIRSKRHMDRVSNVLAMKDAARNITVRQNRNLISKFYLLERSKSQTHFAISVASETRNSGVTIMGT